MLRMQDQMEFHHLPTLEAGLHGRINYDPGLNQDFPSSNHTGDNGGVLYQLFVT